MLGTNMAVLLTDTVPLDFAKLLDHWGNSPNSIEQELVHV